MKPKEMREKLDIVAEKGDDKALKEMLKEMATNGMIPTDSAEALYEEIMNSAAEQSKTVTDLINFQDLSKADRVKTILVSDSAELKFTQNLRVIMQDFFAKLENDDVVKVFLALGSSKTFLDSLMKNDPSFSDKLNEMRLGMFEAGIDEREICKELEPDLQLGDIGK